MDTWGGWVFMNMDLQAESLASYMGILPEHFTRWQPENTYKVLHVEKIIECNWKVAGGLYRVLPHGADAPADPALPGRFQFPVRLLG